MSSRINNTLYHLLTHQSGLPMAFRPIRGMTSLQTFGQHGQGSALYRVGPLHQVTFVFLLHGVMPEGECTERFQRLSDLVITPVV